jgi:signal transduction histidine kinase
LVNEGRLAHELGIATEQVRGKTLDEMFAPEVVAQRLPELERCFAGEGREFIDQIGDRYFRHCPQPVRDADGHITHVIGVITEVTAEASVKRLNDELAARVRQLDAANRQLEAFSYSVSHDLKNPLSAISVLATVLARRAGELSPKARDVVDQIQSATRRMNAIIDDVMAVAHMTSGERQWEDVDLSELARAAVAVLTSTDPSRQVDVLIERHLHALGDHRLLAIAIENLIGNAWKYTRPCERPRIEVGRSERNGQIVYHVRDNGVGFDAEQQERLFLPFERAQGAGGIAGDGVGLATVRRIIEAHDGKIWAESAPGQGATFYFELDPGPLSERRKLRRRSSD